MVFSLWIFDTAALLEAVAAGHAGEVAELVRPGARNAQWIQSLSAIVNGAAFSAKLLAGDRLFATIAYEIMRREQRGGLSYQFVLSYL